MTKMIPLEQPATCAVNDDSEQPCGQMAHWCIFGWLGGPMLAICNEHIQEVAQLTRNATWIQPALNEIDRRERRRLFFAAMRRPEMRLLRLALRHLDWDRDIRWQGVQSIKCEPYANDHCWMLTTDKYLVVCLDAQNPALTYEDFYLLHLHQEGNPACLCEFCREEAEVSHD